MRLIFRITIWTVVLLILFAALEFIGIFSITEAFRCLAVRHAVLSALDDASSVQVIEHSCRFDTVETLNDLNFKETVYATVTLTPKQIEDLRASLPLSFDFHGGILKCIFQEHHRIEIKQRDGTTTTLHLCLHCDQLYLNDKYKYDGTMPPAWPASLRQFIASLGLHPDGPWDKNPEKN